MRTHANRLLASAVALAAAAATMLAAPAASAAETVQTADEAPAPTETVLDAYIEVETYTPGGVLVASRTYGMDTMGKDIEVPGLARIPEVAAAHGEDVSAESDYQSGTNTSMRSAKGCGKATLHNRRSTLLGFNAWDIDIWTYWCWNNANDRVYNVDTGWRIHNMDSQHYWRGWFDTTRKYFSWRSGEPYSGYKHRRQGQVDNCVLKYGCIGAYYPQSDIRSRANGAFWWMVDN